MKLRQGGTCYNFNLINLYPVQQKKKKYAAFAIFEVIAVNVMYVSLCNIGFHTAFITTHSQTDSYFHDIVNLQFVADTIIDMSKCVMQQ